MSSSSATGVSVHGLQKSFGKGGLAVDIAELEIRPGEFVTLVGPSGCGKTTTMRMIVGLEQPTRGEIRFGGRVVNEVPVQRRNVAMVFQNYALYPHLCVRDNLEYGLKKRGFPRSERESRVARVADMLHITSLLDRKPRQLSGGEQQRVALGRAIVREPTVLLLDEPLSNLDAKLRAQMRGELVRLQRRVGYTTIYVTHDQLEAMTMSDRIAVMQAGQVQQFDRPERIYGAPANLFVASFMGSPPMNMLSGTLSNRAECLAFTTTGAEFALHDEIRRRVSAAPVAPREVVLGVRPEDISLSATDGDLQGEVILVELVGAEKHITLECASGTLVTRADVDYPVGVGDRLFCAFRAHKVHVFRAGDGEALR